MDQALKEKWLADLRSGKYAQARDVLHDIRDHAYCCIGVLCLSAGAVFDDFEQDEPSVRSLVNVPVLNERNIGDGDDGGLSLGYIREIGLTAEQQSILIKMNDSGKSFAVIADYIEQNL